MGDDHSSNKMFATSMFIKTGSQNLVDCKKIRCR